MSLKSFATEEWTALFTLYSSQNPEFPQPGQTKGFESHQALAKWIQEGIPWTGNYSREPTKEGYSEIIEWWAECGILGREIDWRGMFEHVKREKGVDRDKNWLLDLNSFDRWTFVYGMKKHTIRGS